MRNNTLHIAFGIDSNFFRPMCVTAISILENNRDIPIEFHVFAFSLTEQDREILKMLENQYQIPFNLHLIDENVFHVQFPGGKNVLLLRLLMADTLRDRTNRVLHLDADMVCTGSLKELISLNLDGYIAAVVSDLPHMVIRQSVSLNIETKRYFNAGFMLINIHEWIARDICQACLNQIISNNERFTFFDQDALNIVIGNDSLYIDRKFNFLCDLRIPDQSISPDTKIIHYIGRPKPWYPYNINPLSDPWFLHYANSPWKDIDLTEITVPRHMRLLSKYLFKISKRGHYRFFNISYDENKINQEIAFF